MKPRQADRQSTNLTIAAERFRRIFARDLAADAFRHIGRLWALWLASLLLIVLAALTLDAVAVVWARDLPEPVLAIFAILTDIGRTPVLLFPTAIFCLVLLAADWRHTSKRIAAAWTEIGILVFFFFLSVASAQLLTQVLKQVFGRGRPVLFDEHGAFYRLPFEFAREYASFPSGHATNLGAASVVLSSIFPRFTWLFMVTFAFLASSRVIVSAHYPSDVIAGFAVGSACTLFYVAAFSGARVGFIKKADGRVRPRLSAVRRLSHRPGGIKAVWAGLWSALARR